MVSGTHPWHKHIFSALLLMCSTLVQAAASYDLAIIGGRVIDPESGLDAIRNIAVQADKIVLITEQPISARKTIDAAGQVVSPGFIDLHAHGQSILAGRMQALDGVTTALELESGMLPVAEYYASRAKEGRAINYGASVNWASARIGALLNVDPQNDLEWVDKIFSETSWQQAVTTPEQLDNIKQRVNQGLQQGALGVGFLSGYAPGAGYKEYYALSKLAADWGVPTFTHARFLSMSEPNSSFQAIEEIVAVAASTGVHAHIVHLNSISLHDIDLIAELIGGAQQRGVKLSTEAYPYGAGSTGIGAAMFKGDHWREQIGGVSAHNFEVAGKRLTEHEFTWLQTNKPETEVIIHFLDLAKAEDQAKLDKAVLFAKGAIASDGGAWLLDGKQVEQHSWPIPAKAWSHPRSAATYARFIRNYVRERGVLSVSQAIEKASLIPAQILQAAVPQMAHKGRLQVGADADIIVFDLDKVSDQASFAEPAKPSTGFNYVIVNGVVLVDDGQLNSSVLPGKAIRRPVTE